MGRERALVPRQLGTNAAWLEARATGNSLLGIQVDGSLWSWNGRRGTGAIGEPLPVGTDRDWRHVFPGTTHAAAIKQDGTLWLWGDNQLGQLGSPPSLPRADPHPLDLGGDWQSVLIIGRFTIALQADGSLWGWGQVPTLMRDARLAGGVLGPTRLCLETNWVELRDGFPPYVRNQDGEWWSLLYDLPDSETSIAQNGRLLSNDVSPGRRVFGFVASPAPSPAVYELREDGTLWVAALVSWWPTPVNPAKQWRRFDERSDWIDLWGTAGAMFGLSRDGTLWTWGVDLGAEPGETFQDRLRRVGNRLARRVGFGTTGRQGAGAMPPVQKEPRPLFQLVSQPESARP